MFSVNSLDALVAKNMLFGEAGRSSSDLKGFIDICDKQYSHIFILIFFLFCFNYLFRMASAKEEPDLAIH